MALEEFTSSVYSRQDSALSRGFFIQFVSKFKVCYAGKDYQR
ncbi:hypothetical protein Desmer_1136 [Desulfosporosinus meridiei DSM 13257]|uniref:Uncharacterized protein n=1 Tax=Desulfosporosinus meridiei (strain ATCC BAA-275 / DSM 13257 / KCTC 12902 / NCIMB 13706 / S10) TaxID=768704 RepID=J7IWS4_DESMD|nr:hypothetical protein Desmer_1136 [Desulfosporosinus meridiei DSM 13257]